MIPSTRVILGFGVRNKIAPNKQASKTPSIKEALYLVRR
jgi:hypothetical protein